MITTTIDLGQIIVAAMVGVVGYLVKRNVDQFDEKLSKFDVRISSHENTIFQINSNVQQLVGAIGLRQASRNHGR